MYENGESVDVLPGWLLSIRAEIFILEEKKFIPFITTSVAGTISRSESRDKDNKTGVLAGTDVRLGLSTGYTLWNVWKVYFSPRIFGGPLFWTREGETEQGRDQYLFQAGIGSSFILPKGITLYIDVSLSGEESIVTGIAWSF